jgi:hypothetical protein
VGRRRGRGDRRREGRQAERRVRRARSDWLISVAALPPVSIRCC